MNFKRTKFNLVRFNPPNNMSYKETEHDKLEYLFEIINEVMTNNTKTKQSRIINRVGYDVYASCGMFINNSDL